MIIGGNVKFWILESKLLELWDILREREGERNSEIERDREREFLGRNYI